MAGQRAAAETLIEALSAAYLNNPTLRAERAALRATDEGVSQALSGWRPTVTASGEAEHFDGESRLVGAPTGSTDHDPRRVDVLITQPVFRGFKTINSTRQAEADVLAGRQSLLNVEQTTLLSGVTAYMDVLRDQSVVELRVNNVDVLTEQLRASEARFKVGEITRTDVAQARARRSRAISDLAAARGELSNSQATYEQVVGRKPGTLKKPTPISRLLPKTMKEAQSVAETRNPEVLSASYTEESARHAIEVAKGDLLPEVNLEAQYSRSEEPGFGTEFSENAQIRGRVTVPLYQAGSVHSRVREAKQTASQRRLQTLEAMRRVRASVIQAWESLVAARERIQAARVQVEANELAFRGVQQEAQVGARTTLDVLDAEQELLDSRVALVTAERDEVVAAFQLLSAIGQLTARDLKLPVPYYDPELHYRKVRNKPFGLGNGVQD